LKNKFPLIPNWIALRDWVGHKSTQNSQVYIHMDRALFQKTVMDEYHVKVAKTKEEIT